MVQETEQMPRRTALFRHITEIAKDSNAIEVASGIDDHRNALDCARMIALQPSDDIDESDNPKED